MGQFPSFEVLNLDDEPMVFPAALQSNCNVMVLSFDEPQQPAAKVWLQKLMERPNGVRVWSLPVVGEQPLFEGVIRRAMKGEKTEGDLLKRYVPIFLEPAPLMRSLQIADKGSVWVGVISPSGLIGLGQRDAQRRKLVSGSAAIKYLRHPACCVSDGAEEQQARS